MEVMSLYIIQRDSGVCLYYHDFAEKMYDPHLLSSFISAMAAFFDEAASMGKSKARAFEGTHSLLLVEFGEWTVGVLSTTQDSFDLRIKLRKIVESFEEQFALLRWVEMDLAIRTRFAPVMIDNFVQGRLHPSTIIHVRGNWEFFTNNSDVIKILRVIPSVCSLKDASEFLELPMETITKLMAQALWDKAIAVVTPPKPEDIFQAKSLVGKTTEGISEETASVIPQLDGETPLSIVAEKVKTSDLRLFLEEIAILAEKEAIEPVTIGQTLIIMYSKILQEIMNRSVSIIGTQVTRKLFYQARHSLMDDYAWVAFIDIDDDVDLNVKSSLTVAITRGTVQPNILQESLNALLYGISTRLKKYIGINPLRIILAKARNNIEMDFPSHSQEIDWESIKLY
jgi:hypothetical protein